MNYFYIAALIVLWKEYDHARAFALSFFSKSKDVAVAATKEAKAKK